MELEFEPELARLDGLLDDDVIFERVRTKKRKEYERQRWFRRAFAFRAGIEGRISVLRRGYSLERCPHHGEDGKMGRLGYSGALGRHRFEAYSSKCLEEMLCEIGLPLGGVLRNSRPRNGHLAYNLACLD